MIKTFDVIIYLIILFLLIAIFFINYFDYNYNIYLISLLTNSENKIQQIKKFVTIKKLFLLNYFLMFYLICSLVLIFFKKKLIKYLCNILFEGKNIFNSIKFKNRNFLYLFLLIIFPSVVIKLFFIFKMSGTYDELFTIINFTSKGFFTSLAYYPAPNNHVLYSIFASIFNYLPFNNLLINRFLNLLVSIFFLLIIYLTLKKEFNLRTSMFVTYFVSSLYPIISYGYLSRGYGLMILFSYISYYFFYKIIFSKNNKTNFNITVISIMMILGISTNPSFLYFTIIIYVFLFIYFFKNNKYEYIQKLIFSSIFIIFSIIIFYSPIILFSGIESILSNRFVESNNNLNYFNIISYYFFNIPNYLFNSIFIFYFLFILLFFLTILKLINFNIFIFKLLFFTSPLILILMHNILPPERIFVFLIAPFIILISIIYHNVRRKNLIIFTSAIFFLLSSLMIYDSYKKIIIHHHLSDIGKIASDYIIKLKPNKIYLAHGLLDTFLIYYSNNNLPIKYSYDDINNLENIHEYDYFVLNNLNYTNKVKLENSFVMDDELKHYNIYIYRNLIYEK